MKLTVKPDKCSGCRLCETACTHAHYGDYGSRSSRVRVVKIEAEGIDCPVVCQQCSNAPCVRACPTGALRQESASGVVEVDESLCTGCGDCVQSCPFGACNLHPQDRVAIICDLCDGEPSCASQCPTGALSVEGSEDELDFSELATIGQGKRDDFARRLCRGMLDEWRNR